MIRKITMTRRRLAGLAAGMLAMGLAGASHAADPIVLRYATQLPATHPLTQADNRFAERVAKQTQGRVKIEVYPAGQLFKGTGLVKAVSTGALDMGIIYGGAMAGQVPTIDVFDIPFVFSDYRKIQTLWHGPVGETIRKSAAQVGIQVLSFGAYGDSFAVINNKRPLRTPADFAGLKIRGNTPVSTDALKALGAAPVGMAAAEVYAAIERGTVDGAATGLGTIASRKWFEVSKYATFTASSYSVWPVMINAKRWESLPADVRTALQEAATAIEGELIAAVEKEDSDYAELIRKKLDVHLLTPEQTALWRKALAPVEADYLTRTGAAGAEILRQARK